MACVGMLLVEVWQSSRLAQLCLSLERSRTALVHARARMEFVRARLERQTTRAEVAPLADELGLAPTDVQQVVQLPSAYLAEAADGPSEGRGPAALALVERAARVLVPDATARSRDKN
jgi:RES domain-containing protein